MRAGAPQKRPSVGYRGGVPPPPRGSRARRVPPLDYLSRSRVCLVMSGCQSEVEATMGERDG